MRARTLKASTRNVIGSYYKWIAAGMIVTLTGCSLASAAPSPSLSSSSKTSEPTSSLVTFQLQEATIAQMQDAMKSGALSSVELTAMYLNRVYAYDSSGIQLNSIPVLNPDVLKEAAQADQQRAQGINTGPLQGIPYTVKDSYKVKGLTVASGSPAFKNLMAKDDAFTVEKIRKSGGVLIGKTNMPPMAAGGMQRGVYGRAESPYNPDYLAAAWYSGSSNGSGVSTAANLAAFGMGEETVSSGRSPASNNGLIAYTPSRGLISIRGNWPLFPIRDVVVPHTRTIEDMLRLLDVIVVEDKITKGDFWREQKAVRLPSVNSVRPNSYLELRDTQALKGKRIGVPKIYIGKDPETTTPIKFRPSIQALWEKAVKDLTALGAEVVEVDFPLQVNSEKDRPTAKTPEERGLMPAKWAEKEFGLLNPYVAEEFLKSVGDPNFPSWANIDPATVFPNPPGSVDAKRGRDLGHYDVFIDTIKKGVTPYEQIPQFQEGLRGLENVRKIDFENWMKQNNLDFIVFPANSNIGKADSDVNETSYEEAWENGNYFSNTNFLLREYGIPSVSVSMGAMKDTGMPVNLTMAGAAYSDNDLLRYAYSYEQATKNRPIATRTPALEDETFSYNPQTALPPSKRKETEAPALKLNASLKGDILALKGSVTDQSEIAQLKVYVNGMRVAITEDKANWSATLPTTIYKQSGASQADTLHILVLAKDIYGNTSAQIKSVTLPQ
ncbi:amidase [Paenibacillus sp. EKM202P]|uniref:amidase n=1 Tax=unclassified Paenibacillus TaxID=185978 RepID=UPI0013ED87F6|nr:MULTISPECIES: amidase [unclassified Paenibacillus]KAF6560076.1 amidase [Paenibacillus sp. EKM202P]KAF6564820.1 amidase [Paenibacillus sp. EKM207P]